MELRTSMGVRYVSHHGGDIFAVKAAKCDPPPWELKSEEELTEKEYKLLDEMMEFRHGSCFEHGSLTIWMELPLFVWAQWHRHRMASYNQESARYRRLKPVFWVPRSHRKSKKVEGFNPMKPEFEMQENTEQQMTYQHMEDAYAAAWEQYTNLVKQGVANEVARAALPVAVYQAGVVTMNPRSIMHFLSLRVDSPDATYDTHPQYEIQEAAVMLERIFGKHWPVTHELFHRHGRVAP